jgi:hypothetical protein
MAMAVSGLLVAHHVAGKASRDAIFLSQFSMTNLPAMVTVAAIVSIAASIAGSRILVRSGPQRLLPLAFDPEHHAAIRGVAAAWLERARGGLRDLPAHGRVRCGADIRVSGLSWPSRSIRDRRKSRSAASAEWERLAAFAGDCSPSGWPPGSESGMW